ncbi:MAG: thioredoxin family protein [Flavobacteriaceae bacterium]
MKYLVLLFFPFILQAQENTTEHAGLSWYVNYSEALDSSKKLHKNVLVYFTGSDWCAPCKKLKEDLFETSDFQDLAKDYVLLYIDIPVNKELLSERQMAHNKQLLPKLNKKGVFPLIKVLDEDENVLDELSGYSMDGDVESYLKFLSANK